MDSAHIIARPGFLYDELWTATALGIRESALPKIISSFDKATYTGIFAFPNIQRWWASSLAEILYQLHKPEAGEMSWHVGRRLAGITGRDFSRCAVCNEPYPETVGYLDASTEERRPMPSDVRSFTRSLKGNCTLMIFA